MAEGGHMGQGGGRVTKSKRCSVMAPLLYGRFWGLSLFAPAVALPGRMSKSGRQNLTANPSWAGGGCLCARGALVCPGLCDGGMKLSCCLQTMLAARSDSASLSATGVGSAAARGTFPGGRDGFCELGALAPGGGAGQKVAQPPGCSVFGGCAQTQPHLCVGALRPWHPAL